MAWRFKASKYKNAAPIVPKFEHYIRDLSIGSYRSQGNFISCSASFMAFNWESCGSSLAVLPLEAKGRRNKSQIPLLHAHSDTVTDFQFSPFDDCLLASGSQDSTVKIWRIPEKEKDPHVYNQINPELTLSSSKRIETVNFHSTADHVLATSSGNSLVLWDLTKGANMYEFSSHGDQVQSVSWQRNGKLLASQCKDRQLRILDPRKDSIAGQCDSHEGIKDSKVVWIGESDRVLTTGFSGDRLREITIRDIRNLRNPIKNMTLDMSSGILVPLFDPDTNMCFLCGKGDRTIQFIEITDRDPYIVEGLKYSGDQTKGACLVPKRAMHVMQGEVNRILQLCDSWIVPITWQVPRKTYREYHADIYPETYSAKSEMSPDDWWIRKEDIPPKKMNLDPKKQKPKQAQEPVKDERHVPGDYSFVKPVSKPPPPAPCKKITDDDVVDDGLALLRRQPSIRDRKKLLEENMRKSQVEPTASSSSSSSSNSPTDENKENKRNEYYEQPTLQKRASKKFGRISKFKHLKGEPLPKNKHFENLKNLSKTIPAECNVIQANPERIAIPIAGPGGKIAVFEVSKSGRIPDGVQPVLINQNTVMDFMWDPFDASRLAVACDDGRIRLWNIPPGGLTNPINEDDSSILSFSAHSEKIQIVKFHPLAKDVILTGSTDRTVKVWDLNEKSPKFILEGHEDQLFSAEWSQCGKLIATLCKDKRIRIFNPHQNRSSPVLEGGDVTPKKGARVVWVLNGDYLVITGFSKQSEQRVSLYRTKDLVQVHSVILAVSPAVLVPYYDEDSHTLFLTGRGESTVTTYEVAYDSPHLFPLSPYKPSGLHQGFAFLSKNVCNVRDVEFARAYRLTNTTIEPISFTVPRVKTALFQDDIFPPTRVLWEPTMTASEWFNGIQKEARRISLKPEDMKSLSQNSVITTTKPVINKLAKKVIEPKSELSSKKIAVDLENSMKEMISFERSDEDMEDRDEWVES